MSASNEQSYYEIALTNRQVLTVFVVLLVCVVAAFFSGVWIGQRGGVERATVEVAQEEALPATEQGTLKELHFFSEGRKRPVPGSPEETDREDRHSGRAVQQPPARELESDEAATTERQAGRAESRPTPPADDEPASTTVAETSEAEIAAGSSQAADRGPLPTEIAGDLVIQVFFSSDQQKADSLVERLVSGGYPAFLSPVEVGNEIMYRVRLGPYQERSEAEVVADRVRRTFKLDTWITQ